ncbi:hypothetical protein ACI2JA_08030 [Alkalihalobacillus sp. NPDC078783]
MNRIHSLNDEATRDKEVKYYREYSGDRYTSTVNHYLTILLPFSKQYIKKSKCDIELNEKFPDFISAIINNCLRIRRFDVLSYYNDHNNSPSARSLHSGTLIFIMNSQAYYYSLYDDELLLISKRELDADRYSRDKVYIVGISDVLNLARIYSEFSLYISMLDAGHLLYNVKNVVGSRKMNFYQAKSIDGNYLKENLNFDSRYTYPSFQLEIDLEISSIPDVQRGIDLRRVVAHDELRCTRHLRGILDKYNECSSIDRAHYSVENVSFFKPIHTLIRNSAHTTIGNNNFGESFSRFHIEYILQFLDQSKKIISGNGLEYCFLLKEEDTVTVYWADGTGEAKDIQFDQVMKHDHRFFQMDSYSIVFVCFSKEKSMLNNGLRSHLLSCGEMMQQVSLYASTVGYAFRPMKNHNDEYLLERLQLGSDYEINYMGVVCNSPVQQLSYTFDS